jgi:hypothetical protein
VHAGFGQHLGLAELGAGDAHRTGRELQAGDLDALVRFEVRAQADRRVAEQVGHAPDVALEPVAIEQQRRRVDRFSGRPDRRCVLGHDPPSDAVV